MAVIILPIQTTGWGSRRGSPRRRSRRIAVITMYGLIGSKLFENTGKEGLPGYEYPGFYPDVTKGQKCIVSSGRGNKGLHTLSVQFTKCARMG
jgi:hypothetical protein